MKQLSFLFLNKPKVTVFFTATGSSAQTQGRGFPGSEGLFFAITALCPSGATQAGRGKADGNQGHRALPGPAPPGRAVCAVLPRACGGAGIAAAPRQAVLCFRPGPRIPQACRAGTLHLPLRVHLPCFHICPSHPEVSLTPRFSAIHCPHRLGDAANIVYTRVVGGLSLIHI